MSMVRPIDRARALQSRANARALDKGWSAVERSPRCCYAAPPSTGGCASPASPSGASRRSTARGSARPGRPAPPARRACARHRRRAARTSSVSPRGRRGRRPARTRRPLAASSASCASSSLCRRQPDRGAVDQHVCRRRLATARAPSSAASCSARSRVRLWIATSRGARLAQRPHRGSRAAARAEHQRALARQRLVDRRDQARGVGVLGGDLPVGSEASACSPRRSRAPPRWRCRPAPARPACAGSSRWRRRSPTRRARVTVCAEQRRRTGSR